MQITFLIGNGFDLSLGLKTKYSDFYKEYCNIDKNQDDEDIQSFKQVLSKNALVSDNNPEVNDLNWADFELAFGQYSSMFKDESKYLKVFDHFVQKFNEYLENLTSKIDYSNIDEISKFMHALANAHLSQNMDKGLKKKMEDFYNQYHGIKQYNFISFNYTNVLDMFVKVWNTKFPQNNTIKLGEIVHIHGTINENMIMGLNDENQLANVRFRLNRRINNRMIKQSQNEIIQTDNDKNTKSIISKSDIIYVYGMSLGATDKKWWKLISNWLTEKSTRKLIILDYYCDNIKLQKYPAVKLDELQRVRDSFLSNLSINEIQKQELNKQIEVLINCIDEHCRLQNKNDKQYILP